MNARNEFDELARRKLEERQFAFDEAAWLDVQRTLATERRRGGAWRWWTLTGAAMLLVGSAIWWNASDNDAATVLPLSEVRSLEKDSAATATAERTKNVATEPEQINGPIAPKAIEKAADVPAASTERLHQPPTTNVARLAEVPSLPSETERNMNSNAGEVEAQGIAQQPVTPSTLDGDPQDDTMRPAANTAQSRTGDATEEPNDVITVPPTILRDTTTQEGEIVDIAIATALQAGQREAQVEEDVNTTGVEEPVPASEEIPVVSVMINEETPPAVVPSTEVNATGTADPTVVNDSAGTATATPPPPPLVDAQSPWEISALGGFFLSNSNYSGGNSDQWKGDVDPLWAPGFGAELMHMGRNWGLGTGLHFTTYAEQLNVAERSVTETFTLDTSYFQPTPMMILVVVDVVELNGQTYYVTETHDTIINVLTRSTMTTTTDRVLVQARDQVNRVSYLEIPLLLDAHLVQGPWSLGLRGGPTLGLLSGRRGAVPNEALDGYTEFSEQQFSEVVFGYTARAYIRYRFSDAWSFGVEPAIKGQLGNGLSGVDLARRNTAFGGMLSVSYRLR